MAAAAALPFAAGDAIFISACAWKNSFYKDNKWPYAVEISNAYFEARLARITKNGTKFQLSFTAFEVDFRKSEYQRYIIFAKQTDITRGCRSFITKYAVKDLPVNAVLITRVMYEDCEMSDTSNADEEVVVDDDFDAFEAEAHDAKAKRRRTRQLFYHYTSLLQIM